MIKKTIIAFLIFFAAYSGLFLFVKQSMQISQHQWQDNMIKAQRFIYNDTLFPNIVVGSSQAARLRLSDQKNFYNLAFSGQSSVEGLSILKHRNLLPDTIFVEMNVVMKEDKGFTAPLTNPFLVALKKYFPSMRDGKQPLAITGAALISMIRKITPASETPAKNIDVKKLLENPVAVNVNDSFSQKDKKLIDGSFSELSDYLHYFHQKKVTIVFFEMPVNASLCNLPKALYIRDHFYKSYPRSEYKYIDQPACGEYETTDGLHLAIPEAEKYTRYFLENRH